MEDIVAKWKAFGWESEMVDGHDFEAMDKALDQAASRRKSGNARPTAIVVKTIKGKGCSFCEGQVGNHNMNYSLEQTKGALAALGVPAKIIPELMLR